VRLEERSDHRARRSSLPARWRHLPALGAALLALTALGAVVAGSPPASAGEVWSNPQQADADALTSVSCTSPSFCMAVDSVGDVLSYDGSTWSSPTLIDPGAALASVSCTSSSFCVAVDESGNALDYHGTSWSAPVSVDPPLLLSVSCASPSFCVAVGYLGSETTYDGTSWSAPSTIDLTNYLNAVSCTSSTFCAAVDSSGHALTYDGTSWSSPDTLGPGSDPMNAVSCTSAAFCTTADNDGNVLTYNGSSWSSARSIDTRFPTLAAVSCTSPSFCVAGDQHGYAAVDHSTTWTPPDYVTDSLASVSCTSSTWCMAVGGLGQAATYGGTDVAAVGDVEFSGSPTSAVVTVTGSGFGALASLGSPTAAGCPANGSNYGSNLWIQDWTLNFVAGRGAACIGIIVSSYSANQVVFSFGTSFVDPLSSGDDFTLSLLGATFTGSVTYSNLATTTCGTEATGCSTTLVDPSQKVEVSGTKAAGSSATITVAVATAVLPCRNFSSAGAVTTVQDSGLATGSHVQVTDTVKGLPSKKGVLVCYQPVEASPPAPVLLGKCHGKRAVPPCVESVVEAGGSAVARLELPAGDPRYHIGGASPEVTSLSPTTAVPGKKLTIKGQNLSEVTKVTIGGVAAHILKEASTKVIVTVPAGARPGNVVVTSLAGAVVAHVTVA